MSVRLLRECEAAIIGVVALKACDVCGVVVVLVDVQSGDCLYVMAALLWFVWVREGCWIGQR